MKIIKPILWKFPVVLAGVAALVSCIKDTQSQPCEQTDITFTVQVPASTLVRSRSVGSAAENKIDNVTVLFFDASENLVGKSPGNSPTVVAGGNADQWKFTIKPAAQGTFDVWVIANTGADFSSVAVGQSKTQIAEALLYDNAKWTVGVSGVNPIAMWGAKSGVSIAAGTSVSGIKLMRMVARINVDASGLSNFELTSVSYHNYNTKGFVIPASVADDKVSVVTTYGKNMAFNTTTALTYAGVGNIDAGKCTDRIYVYETARVISADGKTGWFNNPCLVIGGRYYDGSAWSDDNFYRVDFVHSSGGVDTWLDILRNHSYFVTVSGVNGPGYETEEEAKNAMPINLDSSVIPWNDEGLNDVGYEGQYEIAVNQSVFTFSSVGGDQTLNVSTDYAGGWTIDASDIPTWLTVAPLLGGAGDTDVKISCEENIKDESQTYSFWVTAGKLAKQITVTQNPLINSNNVLYFDRDDRLQVGEWGGDVKVTNMVFFRFGSVVGSMFDGTHWHLSNKICFNPTADTYSVYSDLPVYNAEDYSQGRKNVSVTSGPNAYHTVANIRAGKGDPCKLAGKSGEDIRNMTDDELLGYDSGWRLPTAKENACFVKGPNDKWRTWKYGDPNYSYSTNSTNALVKAKYFETQGVSSISNPGLAWLPASSSNSVDKAGKSLPATGYYQPVVNNGFAQELGKYGYYWSSEPEPVQDGSAYHLDFTENNLKPLGFGTYTMGFPIRCVR